MKNPVFRFLAAVGAIVGLLAIVELVINKTESADQQIINVGDTANDGTADTLRDAFIKVNTNFWDVWATRLLSVNNNVGTNVHVQANEIPISAVGGYSATNVQEFLEEIPLAGAYTANRITISDATGGLNTTNDLTFDGSTLAVSADITLTGDFTHNSLASGTSDSVVIENSGVLEKRAINSGVWGSKTANRVITSDGSGNIGTTNDITFDGATMALTGDLTVSGNATVSTLASSSSDSVITENSGVLEKRTINTGAWGTQTADRLAISDNAGGITTTNDLTFNGTALGITADTTITGTANITGELDLDDDLKLDGDIKSGGEIQLLASEDSITTASYGRSVVIDKSVTTSGSDYHRGIDATITITEATAGSGGSYGLQVKPVYNDTDTQGTSVEMVGVQFQPFITPDATTVSDATGFQTTLGTVGSGSEFNTVTHFEAVLDGAKSDTSEFGYYIQGTADAESWAFYNDTTAPSLLKGGLEIDVASPSANEKLFEVQVGDADRFWVDEDGDGQFSGNLDISGNLDVGALVAGSGFASHTIGRSWASGDLQSGSAPFALLELIDSINEDVNGDYYTLWFRNATTTTGGDLQGNDLYSIKIDPNFSGAAVLDNYYGIDIDPSRTATSYITNSFGLNVKDWTGGSAGTLPGTYTAINIESLGSAATSKAIVVAGANPVEFGGSLTTTGITTTGRGSESAPGLAFTDDTDTGITGDGSGSMTFVSDGSSKITIEPDGDLQLEFGRVNVDESDSEQTAISLTRDDDEGYLQIFNAGSLNTNLRGAGDSYITGGNLGLRDESSPSTAVHITAADPALRLEDSSPSGYSEVSGNGALLTLSADEGNAVAASSIDFRVDGSEVASFDATGNLTLNTLASSSSDSVLAENSGVVEKRTINSQVWATSETWATTTGLSSTYLAQTNNLSDLDNAATARTNLDVYNTQDTALQGGVKLLSQSLYFDGDDWVEFADDDLLTLYNRGLTITASIRPDADLDSDFAIISKDDGTNREYAIDFNENGASDEIRVILYDSGGSTNYSAFTALTGGDLDLGDFQQIAFVWDGVTGTIYRNGIALTTAKADTGTGFATFSNTTAPLRIGRGGSTSYFKGEISKASVYNYPMTLVDVKRSHNDNSPWSEEWAGANYGLYQSDFSAGVDSFSGTRVVLAGNIDGVALVDDTLRATISNDNDNHPIWRLDFLTIGRKYVLEFDYYIPSGNSHLDGIRAGFLTGGASNILIQEDSPTTDVWTHAYGVGIAQSDDVFFYPQDGGSITINDSSGDDIVYLKNVTITEAGATIDLHASTFVNGQWLDKSGAEHTGTNNGASVFGQQKGLEVNAGGLGDSDVVLNVKDSGGNLLSVDASGDATLAGALTISTLASSSSTSFIAENSGVLEKRTINAEIFGNAQTNRIMISDSGGGITTTNDITFDGATMALTGDLTVSGDTTVSTLAAGSTDTVVTHSSNVLETRTINDGVWNTSVDIESANGAKIDMPSIYLDGVDQFIEFPDDDKWSFGQDNIAAYTSDFSAGVDGHTATRGTAADVDSISGQDDNLRLTVDTSNNTHYLTKNASLVTGKTYQISLDYYIPSSNSNADGILVSNTNGSGTIISASTQDAWTSATGEWATTGNGYLIFARDGGIAAFQDAGGDDVIYVRNIVVTELKDDLPFSWSGWIRSDDLSDFRLVSKWGNSASLREWHASIIGTDLLEFSVIDDSANQPSITYDTALTSYEGDWLHIAGTYSGAGPASSNDFSSAGSSFSLFVNGQDVTSNSTVAQSASYLGMENTSQVVYLGRLDTTYAEGYINSVKVYNRELSAAEIAADFNNKPDVSDEFGGDTATSGTLVVGKRYRLQDFISGDDFTNVGAASNADLVEFTATGTTPTTWTNSSVVENIGLLANLSAVNFNEDLGELYDSSDNGFVGTQNNTVVSVGNNRMDIAKEILPMGAIYISSAAETTVSMASTFYKASGTTTLNDTESEVMLLDMPANNRLRYTGASQVHAHIAVTIAMTAAASNKDTDWRIYKYDDSAGTGATLVHSNVSRNIGTSTAVGSTALHADCVLDTNDYIELHLANDTDTTNVTLEEMYMFLMGVRTLDQN